jgi:hypothetical protein
MPSEAAWHYTLILSYLKVLIRPGSPLQVPGRAIAWTFHRVNAPVMQGP